MELLTNAFARRAYELITINPAVEGHSELLKEAYDDVYVPAFPVDDERQPLQVWMDRTDPKSTSSNKYVVIVAGSNLNDPKNRIIEGISVGIYYSKAQVGLMAYNAISPTSRGGGLGHAMVDARIDAFHDLAVQRNEKVRGVFLEVNDPDQVNAEEDSFDPAKRLAIFKKWGAEEVPINYIQPALADDTGKFDKLKLLSYATKEGVRPDVGAVHDFLYELYRGCGYKQPETDFDFMRMKADLYDMARTTGYSFGKTIGVSTAKIFPFPRNDLPAAIPA